MVYVVTIIALMDSKCHPKQFKCDNKGCIDASLVCDGKEDCGDNSDETIGCIGMVYLSNKHLVEFIRLIFVKAVILKLHNKKINAIILGDCPLHNFRCENKRCVEYSSICDGKNDCFDNSDEIEGCNSM